MTRDRAIGYVAGVFGTLILWTVAILAFVDLAVVEWPK